MKRLFIAVYDYFSQRPWVYWVILVVTTIIMTFLSLNITFEEDITRILQVDEKSTELRKILKEGFVNDPLVVCIRNTDSNSIDLENGKKFHDIILTEISKIDSSLIKNVVTGDEINSFSEAYKILIKNLPFYLSESDYQNIDSLVSPASIDRQLQRNIRQLSAPTGSFLKARVTSDPIGLSNSLMQQLQRLGEAMPFIAEDGYFLTKNRNAIVFFIKPASAPGETKKNEELVNVVENIILKAKSDEKFKGIDCFLTGSTKSSVVNAAQIRKDTNLTILVMSLSLLILIILVFRKKRTPFLIFAPVVFGLLFALGTLSLFTEEISLVALGSISVLLGIGVTYPLHLLTHRLYEHDIRQVIADMVEPMIVGSLTTIGGFACLLFVETEVLHDFGLLGIFGLVGVVIFSLIFLPPLLGKQSAPKENELVYKFLNRIGHLKLERNRFLLFTVLIMTPVMLYFSRDIQFDTNLMKLNYTPDDYAENESFIRSNTGRENLNLVFATGEDFNEARIAAEKVSRLSDSLNKAGFGNQFFGVHDFFPSDSVQQERRKLWAHYFNERKTNEIIAALSHSARKYGFREGAFQSFYQLLSTTPPERIDTSDQRILLSTIAKNSVILTPRHSIISSFLETNPGTESLIKSKVSNQDNVFLLDSNYLISRLTELISKDFGFIAVFTSLLVFIALLLTYGRIELAMTAFIPMMVSWIWILGLMGLFNIPFNVVNIVLSTFIFGLGDDYCIFTMDGLIADYRGKEGHLPPVKVSIFFSGLTTVLGFGVMLLAKHPALQSLAMVSLIGITSVLFTSQILQPFLFRQFIIKPTTKKHPPITFFIFLKSVLAFGFFILGCAVISIIGLVFLVVKPVLKERVRRPLNFIISKFAKANIYIMANIPKKIINPEGQDFSKPCIIVANHQSVIDILLLIMLNPKIVLLTNKWVWNSPLFGFIVRMAGYCPVFEGVDYSLERLKERLQHGYSIGVFPEGTRASDGGVHHFHKGAFYIAQELKADIQPIVINGTASCIPKGSFVLYDGSITVKFLPLIEYGDQNYRNSYQEATKKIRNLIREHNAAITVENISLENSKKRLIHNFLFKGPVLEWYMRTKLRIEQNYKVYHENIPMTGRIFDAGCGYGFLSYMLAYQSPQRMITGLDYDFEKITMADRGFDKPSNLTFVHSDMLDYPMEKADCVIFGDVLHYLTDSQRKMLIQQTAKALNPGGVILIRDGDCADGKRHRMTRLSEFFAIDILGFNKASKKVDFFSLHSFIDYGHQLGLTSTVLISKQVSSNSLVMFKKAPDEE